MNHLFSAASAVHGTKFETIIFQSFVKADRVTGREKNGLAVKQINAV